MGDWDFLYEMNARGYSAEDIADAAASGVAPWQWEYVDKQWLDSELEHAPRKRPSSRSPASTALSRAGPPHSLEVHQKMLEDLVDCAIRHFQNTGRYLQIWGELGELYAEINLGLVRHATHQAGSDGTIAGKLVEVKTISPEKGSDRVTVKSQGDFEQLLIVRIDQDFQFRAKLFSRHELKGSTGRFLRGHLPNGDGAT